MNIIPHILSALLFAQTPIGGESSNAAALGSHTTAAHTLTPANAEAVRNDLQELSTQVDSIRQSLSDLGALVGHGKQTITELDIFHGYIWVFAVAFLVTLAATPIMRTLAIRHGIVDRPSEARKIHRMPIAYLGGVGVYLGLLAGIVFSYATPFHGLIDFHPTAKPLTGLPGGVPVSILLGMTVIMLCGLIDDVVGIDPRAKIAGQLFAAAALATEDVGVRLAAGIIVPIAKAVGIHTQMIGGFETVAFHVPFGMLGFTDIPFDVVYWVGTAVIAVFVLGACNASNLIDGLDGLLSGVTAIASIGLLFIALMLALVDDGARGGGANLDPPRIILCLSLLGACLGFLPHNFNPATIFLGDCGSLLLGFVTITIVLTLGTTGQTHLVLAGIIIYAIPIIDTTLAIARRKIARKKISDADDQHLHHMLKRALGVKGAVFALYGIGVAFAVLGVMLSEGRGRVTYALIMLFAAFIGVTSFKIARKEAIERQMREAEARRGLPCDVPTTGAIAVAHATGNGAATAAQPVAAAQSTSPNAPQAAATSPSNI